MHLPMVRSASLLQRLVPWPPTAVTVVTLWMEIHHVYASPMGSGLVHSPLVLVSAFATTNSVVKLWRF